MAAPIAHVGVARGSTYQLSVTKGNGSGKFTAFAKVVHPDGVQEEWSDGEIRPGPKKSQFNKKGKYKISVAVTFDDAAPSGDSADVDSECPADPDSGVCRNNALKADTLPISITVA
ncbi:MAG TPA: hypothetical protein VHE81_00790 [Lacipirellulaceae bacterium]|nr:hypothetical protein [Lacipirellulaceae bacterium]